MAKTKSTATPSNKIVITSNRTSAKIPVELVGVDYEIRPPKAAFAMTFARRLKDAQNEGGDTDGNKMIELMSDFTRLIFGADNAAEIEKRFEDPEDDLDITDMMKVITATMEQVSMDPTT